MREQSGASLRALNEVVERLRAPGGCPWDAAQTHESLRPYLLEETYEVLEAIDHGGGALLREELGDVLLQVLMHCAIAAEETDGFDIGDVAEQTRAKMIHRHPHVFGDVEVDGAAEVVINWEHLKRAEKTGRVSLLDGIPRALPALALALAVQRRPARLGFDETPTVADALETMVRSLDDLAAAIAGDPGEQPARGADWAISEGELRRGGRGDASSASLGMAPAGADAAVGAMLFAAVALARRLRVNPEDALRAHADLVAQRFRALEEGARGDGVDVHDLDHAGWLRRWEATERR